MIEWLDFPKDEIKVSLPLASIFGGVLAPVQPRHDTVTQPVISPAHLNERSLGPPEGWSGQSGLSVFGGRRRRKGGCEGGGHSSAREEEEEEPVSSVHGARWPLLRHRPAIIGAGMHSGRACTPRRGGRGHGAVKPGSAKGPSWQAGLEARRGQTPGQVAAPEQTCSSTV